MESALPAETEQSVAFVGRSTSRHNGEHVLPPEEMTEGQSRLKGETNGALDSEI